MIIPYQKLSDQALHGVIEEFVSRDGTELTDTEPKVTQVRRLLEQGKVVITYDPRTKTCNLISADALRDGDDETHAGWGQQDD